MDRNRLWIVGAIVGMVVVVALGFVVGIQPQLASIAQAESQRAQIQQDNAAKRADLDRLKTEYAQMPELNQKLTSLRTSVPAQSDIPAFLSSLHDLAVATKTTVSSITVSDAQAYQRPKQASTGAKSTSTDAKSTSSTASADSSKSTAAGADDAPKAIVTDPRITDKNFVAIPIAVQVGGSYADALDFVDRLQHGSRLFLVTTFSSAGSSDGSGGSGGASAPDAWNVSGFMYVLVDPAAEGDAPGH